MIQWIRKEVTKSYFQHWAQVGPINMVVHDTGVDFGVNVYAAWEGPQFLSRRFTTLEAAKEHARNLARNRLKEWLDEVEEAPPN